ncbi:hypothetical protein AGMMS50229_12940 [Campylobacterota bacterium]|nr:hypothetical protein AGMMS50229_12940 [Campylobacterota bacterium]
MSRDEFFVQLQDILQTESSVSAQTVLSELEEWDSLAKMSILAFMDTDFRVHLSFGDINAFKTAGDLAARAGL